MVGGKNAEAIEDIKTTPNPMAKGPPMYKNLSLGAVIAIVDNPPTTPAVYQAALNAMKNIFNVQKLQNFIKTTHAQPARKF